MADVWMGLCLSLISFLIGYRIGLVDLNDDDLNEGN